MGIQDGKAAVEESGRRPLLSTSEVQSVAFAAVLVAGPSGIIDIHYLSYNPDGPAEIYWFAKDINSEIIMQPFLWNKLLVGGAVIAKDFRLPFFRTLYPGDSLWLAQTQSPLVNIRYNVFFTGQEI